MIVLSDGRRIHLVEWYCGAQHPDGPPRLPNGITDAERDALIAREHLAIERLRGTHNWRNRRWQARPIGPKDARGGQVIAALPAYGRRRVGRKGTRRIERAMARGRMSPTVLADLLRRHRLTPIVCWCGGWLRRRPVE